MLPSLLLASLALPSPAYRDVAPVLERKCCGCHQRGAAAPMALTSFREVAEWGESIREAVEDGRMPPWGADPKYGHWANDRSLSRPERNLLLAWIDGGCREGGPVKDREPATHDGWRIKPDLVITMPREEVVPAAGPLRYRYVEVPTGFDEDVWVVAAEVRPGNRKAVHHIIVYAPVDGNVIAVDNGMLAAYLPGDDPLVLPPGYAKRIPGGMPLTFQLHYTATGRVETDRSSVGLVFAKRPPAREVRSVTVENGGFSIPPGAAYHKVESSRELPESVELLSLMPHMHLRGKDFTYSATRPGGTTETLLSVPKYDFNWQINYQFKEPLALPAGSRLDCVAHFDNSAANPANPDPTSLVGRGESTEDEMMIGFVDLATPYKGRRTYVLPPAPPYESPVDYDYQVAVFRAGAGLVCCAAGAAVWTFRRRRAAR